MSMKLIIIYGAPAVGKLTVAKELAKSTNFKVFHNHLILDAVESILSPKEKTFWNLVNELRLRVIEVATKEKVQGIIYTSGYNGKSKDDVLENMIKIVEKYRGKVFFVHLICDEKKLFNRVKSDERKKYLKTTTIKRLKTILPKWDMHGDYPNKNNFTIDNTRLTAKKVAKKIIDYYCL